MDVGLSGNSILTSTKIRDTVRISEKFDYLCTDGKGQIVAVEVNPDGSVTETPIKNYGNLDQCIITDGQGDSLVITQRNQIMAINRLELK